MDDEGAAVVGFVADDVDVGGGGGVDWIGAAAVGVE